MSVQIGIPFSLDPNGFISERSTPETQAHDRVESLVQTEPGERVMLPNYGVSASALVFEPDKNIVQNELVQKITFQAAQWEPDIIINVVNIPDNLDEVGTAGIAVNYAVRNNSSIGNQYAVIGPSGVILQKTLRV
jgi:phage baseplate assembly protein W